MLNELYRDTEKKMEKSLDSLGRELSSIRTGRASLSILDSVTVEYYDTQSPLNQVATLSVPESRLIVIQPWDPSVIKEIEKAILRSDLEHDITARHELRHRLSKRMSLLLCGFEHELPVRLEFGCRLNKK